ncbi:type I-B CRISPR-associated protein Cas8b1/Cst1 [Moorella sp. E308F]|uniref:type I-B CRISPR-associated protein Cas8b1/Cst1 n=1 Tax=Moorella sp. E308F TaxID=2572682 RepID=UPI0010FFC05E|nr:type I-B CRISPR-associated protein Cas8b1/Cst1 [Moorella sp. E308F]GEA15000.1 type I-B CRISPR-associated protein Cas8b1/Cst1 [Moorella sp. E308F]
MQDVEIYPTSWYYNACVQGFLEVLAWGLDVDEKKGEEIVVNEILKKDGRAVIPGDIMTLAFSPRGNPHKDYRLKEVPEELPYLKRIGWWWVEKSYKDGFIPSKEKKAERNKLSEAEKIDMVFRRLFHFKGGYYPNLANLAYLKSTTSKADFLNGWFERDNAATVSTLICSFCGEETKLDINSSIYNTFFTRPVSIYLGNSYEEFPNLFWDGNPNLIMCKRCRSYFLCFHLVSKNRFFINSDSFFVNWYLNRLLAGKVDNIRHQSLLDAMQYDQQLRKAVGSWGLQNMELLIFERNGVEYYPISANLARLLLIPEITLLIGQIANNRVWEFILQERFDYLPTMVYKSLRALINMKNDGKDPEVVFEGPGNTLPVNNLIQLYYAIKQQIASNNGGGKMSHINLKEIREAAAEAPINPARNADKNFVYRLLELTRLNKKTEVYHLLLRIYLTSEEKKEFPPPLARLFETNDCELFKTGIYAFIAGLIRSEKITN